MKLAIIGAGMIVHDFLSFIKEIPEIELKAISGVESDLENMKKLKEKYKIEDIFTDYDKCLSEADIDTVYIALPNHLHYSFSKKALESDFHVICEKPFTSKLDEMKDLRSLAKEKELVLLEAITNQYLSNYHEIKEQIKNLGDIKIINCNYSQYSSRYDAFKEGNVLPAFNPKMAGGALMDINIYNIHFVVGLLGSPDEVNYLANVEKGIDTSGVLVLNYGDTKVICIGAKDSTAPIRSTIQGTKGSIILEGPTNVVNYFTLIMNKQEEIKYDKKIHSHRMYEEFKKFAQVIAKKDMSFVDKQLEHSQKVMGVVEKALESAGIKLG